MIPLGLMGETTIATPAGITFVGGDVGDEGSNQADIVLFQPTHQADDFGIVYGISGDDFETHTLVTTGWSLLRTDAEASGTDRRSSIWYKKYLSDIEPNPVFGVSGGNEEHSASLYVFRGVDTATPFDTTEQYDTGVNNPNPTNLPITTTTDNACLILIAGVVSENITTMGVPAAPSGLIEGFSVVGSGTIHRQQVGCYKLGTGVAGVYTPTAWQNTIVSTNGEYQAYTLALRAA